MDASNTPWNILQEHQIHKRAASLKRDINSQCLSPQIQNQKLIYKSLQIPDV